MTFFPGAIVHNSSCYEAYVYDNKPKAAFTRVSPHKLEEHAVAIVLCYAEHANRLNYSWLFILCTHGCGWVSTDAVCTI